MHNKRGGVEFSPLLGYQDCDPITVMMCGTQYLYMPVHAAPDEYDEYYVDGEDARRTQNLVEH